MSGQIAYERDVLPFVRPFTEHLVASVDLAPVHTMLDHGAGTGEVLCSLRAAGYTGSATAVDPSLDMVRRLRTNTAVHPDTAVIHGDLTSLMSARSSESIGSSTPCFDLITSQLVMSFVDDPGAEL